MIIRENNKQRREKVRAERNVTEKLSQGLIIRHLNVNLALNVLPNKQTRVYYWCRAAVP